MKKAFVAPADLAPPFVLTTVREKILFSQILYLKVFAEPWRESSPPEASASSTNQNLNYKQKGRQMPPFDLYLHHIFHLFGVKGHKSLVELLCRVVAHLLLTVIHRGYLKDNGKISSGLYGNCE